MDLVELDVITLEQSREMGAEEPGVWGGGPAEALEWRAKERHLALRESSGGLLAVAGAGTVGVSVAGAPAFEVVGIGGVFVRPAARGQGLMRRIFAEVLELARTMGPEWAMLFCGTHMAPVYESFGFVLIEDAVWAEQPGGAVEIPSCAMSLALHGSPGWPAGRVDVQGLPF